MSHFSKTKRKGGGRGMRKGREGGMKKVTRKLRSLGII
jgi:hypothetical protein